MDKRPLGKTGLSIAPLVLGGNVFGWTADDRTSFAVLDAFLDHGFGAIDTADSYQTWIPGHAGKSESVIGAWLKARPGARDKVTIFTKVGSDMGGGPGRKGLSAKWILEEAEASLSRLGVDAIDVYFSHWPDPETPCEETLGAYEKLIQAGKVKAIGASNVDADQLAEALRTAQDKGLPRYQVLEPHYNLVERGKFEGPLRDLCLAEGLGVVPYFALASGFLTGKYRTPADFGKSPRGQGMAKLLSPRGLAILGALDEVAARRGAQPAEVAIAWLAAQPGVTAPIASATSVEQLESLARAADLKLAPDDLALLGEASA